MKLRPLPTYCPLYTHGHHATCIYSNIKQFNIPKQIHIIFAGGILSELVLLPVVISGSNNHCADTDGVVFLYISLSMRALTV